MGSDSSHRFLFFESSLDARSPNVELEGDEYRHLARVLRIPVGETVYVTNGRGLIVECRVEDIDKQRARLRVTGVEVENTSRRGATLALACLKKDAFEKAVEQCTELGVSTIVPFVSKKTHLRGYSRAFFTRLERIALSAIKQSFRSVLPDIRMAIPYDDLIEMVRQSNPALVGDAEGKPIGPSAGDGQPLIIVGPEGGFTDDERNGLAAAGGELVSVSRFRLRSETAAAAMAAIVMSSDRRP
jgi:16S rRNA (uracil1498-N3)-methyltransferase